MLAYLLFFFLLLLTFNFYVARWKGYFTIYLHIWESLISNVYTENLGFGNSFLFIKSQLICTKINFSLYIVTRVFLFLWILFVVLICLKNCKNNQKSLIIDILHSFDFSKLFQRISLPLITSWFKLNRTKGIGFIFSSTDASIISFTLDWYERLITISSMRLAKGLVQGALQSSLRGRLPGSAIYLWCEQAISLLVKIN